MILDFMIPRETVSAYIYDQEPIGRNLFIRSANTANFIVQITDHRHKIDFTDQDLFVFRTRLFGRVDPLVMKNEDATFKVIYNNRTTYFIVPILGIILSLLILYFKPSEVDDVFEAAFICFLIVLQVINLMLNINAFVFFRG
ncbi:hypothetical protein [Flammeovirga sp. SJP92]|uniref:hypothetical protein n=1 Tax=Flammeovirga sp. SJP92 TaxID=1775430 RepID=UPI0007885652|nr:hypothetical protein [Flammeovirga sp. SJP92]KXX70111.1 hypothetical protein AVL50_14670 [Flammeovirga sp. SJP92]